MRLVVGLAAFTVCWQEDGNGRESLNTAEQVIFEHVTENIILFSPWKPCETYIWEK
jgi:hypothetical protein